MYSIKDDLTEFLKDYTSFPIKEDSLLKQHLGLDSLDIMELIMQVESKHKVSIDDFDLMRNSDGTKKQDITFSELIFYIEKKINKPTDSPFFQLQ